VRSMRSTTYVCTTWCGISCLKKMSRLSLWPQILALELKFQHMWGQCHDLVDFFARKWSTILSPKYTHLFVHYNQSQKSPFTKLAKKYLQQNGEHSPPK
jgi:hypothetical protein